MVERKHKNNPIYISGYMSGFFFGYGLCIIIASSIVLLGDSDWRGSIAGIVVGATVIFSSGYIGRFFARKVEEENTKH